MHLGLLRRKNKINKKQIEVIETPQDMLLTLCETRDYQHIQENHPSVL